MTINWLICKYAWFCFMVLGIFPICNFPNSGIFIGKKKFKRGNLILKQILIFFGFTICQIFQRKRIGKRVFFFFVFFFKNRILGSSKIGKQYNVERCSKNNFCTFIFCVCTQIKFG